MNDGEKKVYQLEWAGRPFVVEIGHVAKQANGAVLARYGDTAVLCTVTASKDAKDLDFFPLTVNYEERLYAVGKIPGGFIKREGRPSETAILASRLIDRPIRPLFPEGFRNEVHVISTVLSVDQDCSPEITAMIGSSLALMISDIPFHGPIAGVEVGRVNGQFVINPTLVDREQSDMELVVAGTGQGINMVEAGALEVPEEVMLEAMWRGHEEIKKLVAFQEQIAKELGKEKMEPELLVLNPDLVASVEAYAKAPLLEAIMVKGKKEREAAIDAVKENTLEHFTEQFADDEESEREEKLKEVSSAFDQLLKKEVRRLITEEKIRPDGRRADEIRPITCEVGLLKRTHGSALFTRGQTQALSVCTLGALGDVQILDGLEVEESKRFMHHYNFPPYSVGEARAPRAPGRREIGHGALGERALEAIIPSEDEFPYTIRLVSEVLESNGSTSQASICASTLALMDAGVPIKAPVAGIAMGLIKEGDEITILSDIQGIEDALGDMDFKVAGTKQGITALQMDIKIDQLSKEIMAKALEQAKRGRLYILNKMLAVLDKPRKELSPYAPKIITMRIPPEKIRDVIGPSGRMINQIIDETGVKIDIEQDGRLYIASPDVAMIEKARQIIENIVREVEVGETYLGKVKRIEKFGAFVEILPGKEGLVHISQLAEGRVNKVEDVVKIGDDILVKVTEIDEQGRVNLSRKALLKKDRPHRTVGKQN